MSDGTSSEHSSDPDFQPTKNILNILPTPSDRQTRTEAKHRSRNKILNDFNWGVINKENLLQLSIRFTGSTEAILDTKSNLLDE